MRAEGFKRAKAFLERFDGDYKYLTSEFKRDLDANNALRAVTWSLQNDSVAFVAPDRGGRVPAILVREMYSFIVNDSYTPPALFCNLDPMWNFLRNDIQYSERSLLNATDEEKEAKLQNLGQHALILMPGFLEIIGFLSVYRKRGIDPGVTIIDDTVVNGNTMNLLRTLFHGNGFRKVGTFSMHDGVSNRYLHEPGMSHLGIPEVALGVNKHEVGVSMMKPFPEEALIFRMEMKRLAAETIVNAEENSRT